MDSRSDDFDALLAHAGWLRSLAQRLVRDVHAADDLVQNAWVAALEHPPRGDAPLRRWLALVLRNFARQERRGARRREAREAFAARVEAVESPPPRADDAAASLASQRALFDAVSALDEPYRTVIVQRYYEGLAPREIARRTGLPVKTVKTRLHRALGKLRARLDRRFGGDRRAWLLALVPIVDRGAWTPLGVVWMDAKLKAAIAVAVIAGAVATYVGVSDSGREIARAEPRIAASDAAIEAREDAPLSIPAASPPERFEIPSAKAQSPAAAPGSAVGAPTPRPVIEGRVIDLAGRPVANVAVVVAARAPSDVAPQVIARTDAEGRFTIERNRPDGLLEVERGPWVTVLAAQGWSVAESSRTVLVVAPRQPLAGVVVDAQGAPVADALVSIAFDESFRSELGEILDDAFQKNWSTRTDEEGRFELADAPAARGSLVASSLAHVERRVAIPAMTRLDLVLALDSREEPHVVVTGIVVDAQGAPVPGAHVAIGMRTVETDAEGRFAVDVQDGAERRATKDAHGIWHARDDISRVLAAKPGHLPAEASLPTLAEMRASPPAPIVLRLGPPPLAIRGVVRDEEGAPLARVAIEALDETLFGRIQRTSGNASAYIDVSIEKMLRGGLQSGLAYSENDGAFELAGLLDRSYRLSVTQIDTLRSFVTPPIAVGSASVELRFPADARCGRVAGRVVGRDGEPIEGARVAAGRISDPENGQPAFGPSVITEPDGRFEFPKLALDGLGFHIGGENVFVEFWRPLPKDQDPERLELDVSRRCHVQADLGDRLDFADAFYALDDRGERAQFMQFQGVSIWSPPQMPIVNGKSDAIAVEDTARTIVFLKNGAEVERVPVKLTLGEVNVVRP